MSERRDSNPRPSPWQGDAPPIELLSQIVKTITQSSDLSGVHRTAPPIELLSQTSRYIGIVPKIGLEPISQVFQTSAVTILATSAKSKLIITRLNGFYRNLI